MAQITPFTYIKGHCALHLLDPRLKFFMVCLVSMSMLSAGFFPCFFYFWIVLFFFKKSGLCFFTMMKRIKFFLILLFFVFLARAVTIPGDIIFSFYGLTVTEQGVADGTMAVFKFFLVMLTGLVFSATTPVSHIKSAVQWFLTPIPLVPEKRVAVMISLSLCFMPIILRQAKEISDAQKARCADLKKNPAQKIIRLVLPLFKKIFLTADNRVLAMESRCYSDDRTDPEFIPSGKEKYFFCGTLAVSLCLIIF